MEPFTVVVVGAVVLFVLVGVGSFLAGGSLYDKIGEGGLIDGPARARRRRTRRWPWPSASRRSARCCRHAATGRCAKAEPALDIDAELALTRRTGRTAARSANTTWG